MNKNDVHVHRKYLQEEVVGVVVHWHRLAIVGGGVVCHWEWLLESLK